MSDSWIGDPIVFGASALIAFSITSLVIALDCWRQNSSEFLYSTYPVFRDPFGLLFCAVFGAIAAATFIYVQYDRTAWLAEAMTLKVTHPLARGALVGLSVMIVVRSKVLQLSKDAGVSRRTKDSVTVRRNHQRHLQSMTFCGPPTIRRWHEMLWTSLEFGTSKTGSTANTLVSAEVRGHRQRTGPRSII